MKKIHTLFLTALAPLITQTAVAGTSVVTSYGDYVTFSHAHSPSQFRVETPKGSPAEFENFFTLSAKRIGVMAKIEDCSLIIDIPAGKNHSYGASCKLVTAEKQVDVVLCHDDVVQRFALASTIGQASRDDIVEFTVSNCFGG